MRPLASSQLCLCANRKWGRGDASQLSHQLIKDRVTVGYLQGASFFLDNCASLGFLIVVSFFFLITVFYYCFFPPLSSSIPIQITDSCCFRRLTKLFGRSPNHQHGGLSHSGVSLEAVMRIFFSVKTNENNMCQELCKSSL